MNGALRWISAAMFLIVVGLPPGMASAQKVRTLSTGISADERVPQSGYSLLIIFATSKGQLLAGIDVAIKDSGGKTIVTSDSSGPWLFVALPAGNYTVTAQRGKGKITASPVTVPASGQERLWMTF